MWNLFITGVLGERSSDNIIKLLLKKTSTEILNCISSFYSIFTEQMLNILSAFIIQVSSAAFVLTETNDLLC